MIYIFFFGCITATMRRAEEGSNYTSLQAIQSCFITWRCAIQLANGLVRYGPLFIIARRESIYACMQKRQNNHITHVQTSLRPKKSVNPTTNIQIKFWLQHCISCIKIFKTRPHLTIFGEFYFSLYFFIKLERMDFCEQMHISLRTKY